ncbi:MAG: guanylate kinase [bacterium]|nr:guanylate kinase [bacterium]
MNGGAGKLFVLSSPSGGGKTTVLSEVLRRDPTLRYSVSATTRPPRPGERDGVDYHFMDPGEFDRRIRSGGFLEWAEVHGNRYGTPVEPVLGWVEAGERVILDLDVQGALDVKRSAPRSVLIFLLPPSLSALRERLERRGTDRPDAVQSRLAAAEREMAQCEQYDFVIFNDRLEDAVDCLQAVLRHAGDPQHRSTCNGASNEGIIDG